MADRSIKVIIGANVNGFVNGLRTASQAAKDFGTRTSGYITRNEQHINTLSRSVGALGLGMVAAAGLAVKTFADFDKQMSNVAATGDDATASLGALRDAALQAGRDTAYSATQAAGGVEQLLKAGVSAKDVLGGGLTGALSLAAAGELDVADAAEIAATAMSQFNLKGDQVSHVADLLSAGAAKAQGDVTDFAAAMKFVGPVANGMGVSLEEVIGTLTKFAKQGVLGEQAGTSLRGVLSSLTSPSAQAKAELDRLGVSLYDATGKFKGLSNVETELQKAYGGMTDAQRDFSLGVIFGNQQITAARLLLNQNAGSVKEWTAAVDDQGYAARVAGERLNNLSGDLQILRGSVETALIGMGEAANGPLRNLTQRTTDLVNAFAQAPGSVQGVTLALVGGGGLVALGVAGMGKLAVSINNVKNALTAMKISGKTATIAVTGVGAALAVAGLALSAWAQNAAEARARTEELKGTLDEFGRTTNDTLSSINTELAKTRGSKFLFFGSDPYSLIDVGQKLGLTVDDLQGYILGEAQATERVTAAMEAYIKAGTGSQSQMIEHAGAVNQLRNGLDREKNSLSDSKREALQKAEADKKAGLAAQQTEEFTQDATAAIERNTNALSDNIDALTKAAGGALDLWDAQTAVADSYDKAAKSAKDNGKTLKDNTAAGRENRDALSALVNDHFAYIDALTKNGASLTDLRGAMTTARQDFVDMAMKMGASKEEAEALADSFHLIPSEVKTDVKVTDRASNVLDSIWTKIKRIGDLTITTNAVTGSSSFRYGNNMAGFDVGGYTGNLPRNAPAGIVHGQEFVVNAAATAKHRPYLESINRGLPGYQSGGYVTPAPSLVGLEVVGTLDTPWGPSQMRAVVRDEFDAAGRRAGMGVS